MVSSCISASGVGGPVKIEMTVMSNTLTVQ